MSYVIGVDYGTNSVRALLVRCSDGKEISSAVWTYEHGVEGILLNERDANVARQHPKDYLVGLETTITEALAIAKKNVGSFNPDDVIGIGVDSTGSSPIPVDDQNQSLVEQETWKDNLSAQCWLWKDHTSFAEAQEITALAKEIRPQFLAKCGGTYSSEWWWSKILRCARVTPDVFEAAYSWVELCDWIPSVLAGISDPREVVRSICAAGHKAMYAEDWGGLPDNEFLEKLDSRLPDLRARLYEKAHNIATPAGTLCEAWAKRLGLKEGIHLAVGEFDVHYGAIGCGVKEGTLVKVIGTSTCDCGVVSNTNKVPDIPGICGIVDGAILPGFYGIEAGQSAVGDIFKWWVEGVCQGKPDLHQKMTDKAEKLKPGQSGLLALDWNNGNRTILVDQRLTGLLLGQTLHTKDYEIYRALIEGTAFGARKILERLREYGVVTKQIVCAGGIAEKNAMLMQIYADVTGCELRVSSSSQTCALGSAVGVAVLAGSKHGGFDSFTEAIETMTSLKEVTYKPIPENQQVYDQIYEQYEILHDSFGGVQNTPVHNVMKKLLEIKEQTNKTHHE